MGPPLADFVCKSLLALVIKISFGCTRDFRVEMWGTSSPEDKVAGDLANVIEATSAGGRRSDFFTAEKLATENLRLLQQYRHIPAQSLFSGMCAAGGSRHVIRDTERKQERNRNENYHHFCCTGTHTRESSLRGA
jgi:hypothetical protein